MKKKILVSTIMTLGLIFGLVGNAFGLAPYPNYGTGIVVDGDPSDWDLTNDFFADMYEAGNPTKTLLSKSYLRYDCTSNTLYVLVLTEDEGYALAGSWLADEGRRFCLVKANATGQMQWTRTYEVAGYGPFAQSVVRTTDGGYMLAGYSSHLTDGDFVMVKTDAFGLIANCELGLSLSEYTADTVTLYRGAIDPYWNYVRICMWAIRES